MITPSVGVENVAQTFRILRNIDPDSVKQLRSELNGQLRPLAKAIAAKYPTTPTLSGFAQSYGRWNWGQVTGTVKITPGKTRKGSGRTNLVALSMNYKSATPFVLDMIGRRNPGISPQGQALYRAINQQFTAWPKGGRIFYKPFKESAGQVQRTAEGIITRWSDTVTKELS